MAEMPDRAIAPLLEENLDDLYEHAPCGYLSALADGTIVKVNQTFLDWTGYAREDLVGTRRFQDLLTAGGRIYHETHYAPLLRMQGSVREIALQVVRSDGSRMPVLVNSVLRSADDEHRTVVRTTVFDASDRRAYEEELLRARRREAEARERTERLQRLTEALAASLDEREIAAATLGTAMEAVGATGGCVEAGGLAGDRPAILAGEPPEAGAAEEALELMGSGRPLGRLRLRFPAPPERDAADEAFLVACARQCAQALERARLHAQTVESAGRAAFLAELARALGGTRSYAARAQRLADAVVPALAVTARLESTDERGRRVVLGEAGSAPAGARLDGAVDLELHARDRPLGVLALRRGEPYSEGEREFLADVAVRAGLALENARLYEHEHAVAVAFQRSMLTRELPRAPGFLVAAHYQPAVEAMEVGGDWYDAFSPADGRLVLVVGDVVGRGIDAASAMGQLRSAARALASGTASPAELLERLDEFVEHVDVARSSTIACADLDLATGTLRYACAAHPPPLLIPPDGAPELLWDGRSPPLGAFGRPVDRPQAQVVLQPGSRVLIYTDGLVERRDRPVDRGLAELVAAVGANPFTPLPSLVERLPRQLVRADDSRDDVCLLGVSYGASTGFERGVDADVSQLAPLRADLRAWLAGHAVGDEDQSAIVLACSEAAANAIEHGCGGDPSCRVSVSARLSGEGVELTVRDDGTWRESSGRRDRGRGLTLIGHFMDEIDVEHGEGTTVRMRRRLGGEAAA